MRKHLKASSADRLYQDLEQLYDLALSQDNLSVALRVKELQAKLFVLKTGQTARLHKPLQELTDEELDELLSALEGCVDRSP